MCVVICDDVTASSVGEEVVLSNVAWAGNKIRLFKICPVQQLRQTVKALDDRFVLQRRSLSQRA